MDNIELRISTDFSATPGARYKEEGDFSGEEFREEVLFPKYEEAKNKGVHLIVNLDGTAGLGTSFLEESFGGLIRTHKVDYHELSVIMEFISEENPDYIEEIKDYIKDANEKENHK